LTAGELSSYFPCSEPGSGDK